jgi:hypothetical protein
MQNTNEIQIRKNRIVNITPWKARTKKDFISLIKNKKDKMTEEDIVGCLVTPYIEEKDIYLTSYEIQYLLINIRNISIKEDITSTIKCLDCSESIKINKNVMDFVKYKPADIPCTVNNVTFKEIQNKNTIKDAKIKYPDENETDLEMLFSIEKIKDKIVQSFQDILEYYEDLDLESANNISDSYLESRSNLSIEITETCPKCKKTNTWYFDTMPGFFDALLPKEIDSTKFGL